MFFEININIPKTYPDLILVTCHNSRCNYQLQLEVSGLEVYTERRTPSPSLDTITNAAEAWSQRCVEKIYPWKLNKKCYVILKIWKFIDGKLNDCYFVRRWMTERLYKKPISIGCDL